MNLLVNAIDAIEDKPEVVHSKIEPTIAIQTEAKPEQDCVIVRISDNETGMSSEVQRRIYDQFFTTKPVGKGTGLGLAISHSIVAEKHGGHLNCWSKLGEGTEFVITLPISQPELFN